MAKLDKQEVYQTLKDRVTKLYTICDLLDRKQKTIELVSIEDFMFLEDIQIKSGLHWFKVIDKQYLQPMYDWYDQQTDAYWKNLVVYQCQGMPELQMLSIKLAALTKYVRQNRRPAIFSRKVINEARAQEKKKRREEEKQFRLANASTVSVDNPDDKPHEGDRQQDK